MIYFLFLYIILFIFIFFFIFTIFIFFPSSSSFFILSYNCFWLRFFCFLNTFFIFLIIFFNFINLFKSSFYKISSYRTSRLWICSWIWFTWMIRIRFRIILELFFSNRYLYHQLFIFFNNICLINICHLKIILSL